MDKNKIVNKIKTVVYYAIPIAIFISIAIQIFNQSIWLDEAFSLSMI